MPKHVIPLNLGEQNGSPLECRIKDELAPPHAQSAWGSRREKVRAAGLTTCYNYFLKKKRNVALVFQQKERNYGPVEHHLMI